MGLGKVLNPSLQPSLYSLSDTRPATKLRRVLQGIGPNILQNSTPLPNGAPFSNQGFDSPIFLRPHPIIYPKPPPGKEMRTHYVPRIPLAYRSRFH